MDTKLPVDKVREIMRVAQEPVSLETSGWRIIRTGCLRWSRRTSAPFYRKGPSTD